MTRPNSVFLRSIEFIDSNEIPAGFPFDVPAVESMQRIEFASAVTFFVGENGSGKSTVMEAMAAGMKATAMGSADIDRDDTLTHAAALARHLRFVKTRKPKRSFFFRAEDAFGFTRRIQNEVKELKEIEQHFDATLAGYGKVLATGAVRGQQQAFADKYGENPDAQSHGELFLSLLQARINPEGLYFMDEPEAPLSPIHQLSLLSIIKESVEQSGCQFVIATHSPILMAYPGAVLYDFDSVPPQVIEWEDVEHVSLTKAFLNNPQNFLRHL